MNPPGRPRPLSIYFLIRSLNLGGAERQLVYLATRLHRAGHDVTVAVYYSGGVLDSDLVNVGVRLVDLGKKGRWDLIGFIWRLIRSVRNLRPDVLYSFLGSSNIFAAVIRPFVHVPKFVWSIRASDMDAASYDWAVRVSYRIECLLSPAASLIIGNSNAGLSYAAAHGFPRQKMVLVPNGIDTDRFKPDPKARSNVRAVWDVDDDQILVGLLARLDPMKGHATFLKAAALAATRNSRLRFVCVGTGPPSYLQELLELADKLGVGERVMWAGPSSYPEVTLNALDIFCSSSAWGEGFSNSVGEAMACGLPCVVTNVGDSAWIVGDAGRVVPPGDARALAEVLLQTAEDLSSFIDKDPRGRIERLFSVAALVDNTLAAIGLPAAPSKARLR
ncbi:MAG: glycosyltransferase [Pseudomonadota bacterium]|nr:glycosyltransferase [Pseudomonadota bacterium]